MLAILGIALILLTYIFIIKKPTNNGNWEVGMERLPHIAIEGNRINAEGVRDFRYDNKGATSSGYISKSIDVTKLSKVWFVVEPFSKWGGVAHTYFVFDFTDQDPLLISVEARREKGQKYSVYTGTLNQFTLIYLWGTEKDETISRVVVENNKLYMYPLNISQTGAQNLLLQMAKASQDLETQPRFYNTFLSNCTNELAKAANKAKANAIPWNIALFLPGYAPSILYKLGYISNERSLEETMSRYYISDTVKKIYKDDNFSAELRNSLTSN